jgi:alpha-N-arabinofuranosidase
MKRNLSLAGLLIGTLAAGCSGVKDSGSSATPMRPTSASITVDVDRPGAKINPAMWGAFFEDINFGADGGLYAQMVKNGTFEFPESMMGWIAVKPSLADGDVTVIEDEPYKQSNPHFVRVTSRNNAPIGISNEGFRGMGVRAGDAYDFSAQIRRIDRAPKVTVEIVGSDGTTLDVVPLEPTSGTWSKITATLHPKDTDANARLAIFLEGRGSVAFDFVSLFPEKTWKNRPGGLRADMVQALADLKPGFLRFPGGCIVEGSDLSKRYQWKNTIGPVEDRKLIVNRWNYEFKHRPTPDYYQSFGLGFFEFFQLCEDIGAQPLPIINCGMACQFNSGEVCKPEDLKNYIQDALDLIEFANGPASSTWGAKRAEMGHPEPFGMKMMGVGNEQWGPQYIERQIAFTKAIKSVHPEIMLVSDAGPSPSDERFEFLWPKLHELHADIVDQHCYANPVWFLANADRFDKYDRNGPKIFFGEYAAQSVAIVSTKNRNNLECALSEAAYMTGLERNADVVRMASYAPLFANVEAWQWTPNLIWTDSLRVLPTVNYYAQQMYTLNRGDVVLPVTNDAPVREILPSGRLGFGTSRASAEFKDLQVTAAGATTIEREFAQPDPNGTVMHYAGVGDPNGHDYSISVKARKTGGSGSIVMTVCDDKQGAWARWILGGWSNSQHGILTHYAEQDQLLGRVPGSLENNRWYDVKVVVNGSKMECYLDGKLIQSEQILLRRVPSLFASATRDDQSGEVILKVVNPTSQPAAVSVNLRSAERVNSTAKVIELAGNNPSDENTFDHAVVVPKSSEVSGIKPQFTRTFKPRSFTILRIATGVR